MSVTWNHNLIYPTDSTGPYQEFEGKIVKVEDLRDIGLAKVFLEVTGVGELSGYWHIPDHHRHEESWLPPVGGTARIHCYDAGGGWYPDDKIMGWTAPRTS